jgi:hypothetical protein
MSDTEILELNDLNDLAGADTAEMTVWLNGKATSWKWIWAGPGHPKTIAQRRRLDRERLSMEAQQEQARVNGRKYKSPEIDPDEDFKSKVTQLIERLVDWTPVKVGGQVLEFSETKAREILSNPANVALYIQCWEFLGAETSFTKRLASNSETSPSATSA